MEKEDEEKKKKNLEMEEKMALLAKLNFNFRKILPKKKSVFISPYNYLTNSQILEILEQFEIFIQLLIQNYLFIKNKDKKIEIHNLIDKINLQKNQFIFLNGLRTYDVYLVDFKFGNNSLNTLRYHIFNRIDSISEDLKKLDPSLLEDTKKYSVESLQQIISFQMAPQVSVLQSPILEIISLINQALQKDINLNKKISLLKELVPFVNKRYIPVFLDSGKSLKFNKIDDALLLNGLIKFSSKNLSLIHKNFLSHKTTEEIKNRFKNLTRFKSIKNKIKNWKITEIAPLTKVEMENLKKGKIWFGKENYTLISKYFLPRRTPRFLKLNDNKDAKLLVKRSQSYFEFSEENIENIVADKMYDYYYESEQKYQLNTKFINFLEKYSKNNQTIPRMLPRKSLDFDNTYLTIKLSEKNLSITKNNKNGRDCLIFNKNSILNSKIRFLNDKLIFNNKRIRKKESKVKLKMLTKNNQEFKNGLDNEYNNIKRLCPSIKEIQEISKQIANSNNQNLSNTNGTFYQKMFFKK